MKPAIPAGWLPALLLPFLACSQPQFTAKDTVPPFTGGFGYGTNMGYFPPHYYDKELAALAHGTPDGRAPGFGITAIRPGLFDYFLDQFGFGARKQHFQYYDSIGLRNTVVIIGFPAERNREQAEHCPGIRSEMFKNLYEPIWDNGENGTPINEKNNYALYVWKAARVYKGLIKIWEVWNEPDADTGNAWKSPGMSGNWWENAPGPCETKLKSPIFYYIRTLRITYEVVKTIDPSSYVAVGGLGWPAYLDAVCRYTDEPEQGAVVDGKYPHTGGAYFDCMSFHSYPHLDNSLREWSNGINGFRYFRHSDAAVDGLWRLRDKFDAVLKKRGFDHRIYPEKIWICSEYNIPRKAFGEFIGSDTAQVNFLIKSLVTAQMKGMAQMHIYSLADEKPEQEASNEFSYMGLFKNLNQVKPYAGEPNAAAWAMKTTQTLLGASQYDSVQTGRLRLPATVRGAAFRDKNGRYTWVLWAKTSRDNNEAADTAYAFPKEWNLKTLVQRDWDYSRTLTSRRVPAGQVRLSGSPAFFRVE